MIILEESFHAGTKGLHFVNGLATLCFLMTQSWLGNLYRQAMEKASLPIFNFFFLSFRTPWQSRFTSLDLEFSANGDAVLS